MQKNYIGFVRDHSVSMKYIARAAARDYNSNLASTRSAAARNNIETLVSVVECGYGHTDSIRRVVTNENVSSVQNLAESAYVTNGGGTPLFDSVGDLIENFEAVQASLDAAAKSKPKVDPYTAMGKEELRQACRDAGISYSKLNNEGMREVLRTKFGAPVSTPDDVSYLVMAVTDGQENASRRWSARSIADKIRKLQATDRWTFVFRVPRGYSHQLIGMGIPAGNILEWDQTEQGVEVATRATEAAMDTYYEGRTRGFAATKNFYSSNLNNVSKQTIKAKLVDITNEVQFFDVRSEDAIKPFIERMTNRAFIKGTGFYQLTKTEDEVQDYKILVIRDKKTGKVYSGVHARNILGFPHNGTIKVVPGNHGGYDLFIQSTSVNRKLKAGTQVMVWNGATA